MTRQAQFIVNHYILTYHKHITNALFEQNFGYTVCRVVYGSARIEDVEARYPKMTGFAKAYYTLLIHHHEVHLSDGQIVLSACVTLAGDGLTNSAQVRFKGLQAGVSNTIYKHLKTKEKQGLVLVIDMDEFRTSKRFELVIEDLAHFVVNHKAPP
ncbi:hypothetical protein BDF20DRAFT_834479 [Mycotypha africana]|uniref:uncharacterized protein n=1 Tax=Mycotypha africana TaxID=64632 RepID=UPI00230069D2|nr:uncharacterized protein BDF20DRAFT_834479 [Mycotypha africana]KAI8981799.1 hypothetical protein BDF20DRAFT_834479 [Mycotypha africana]